MLLVSLLILRRCTKCLWENTATKGRTSFHKVK